MSNVIKVKRGAKASLSTLSEGEFGFCTDTNELYIGTSGGNVLINGDAPNVLIQFSADNTNWHTDYQQGDAYIRFSNDNGVTWTNGVPVATNADTVDGYHATDFVLATDYEDLDVLNKIKNVDGTGSGLDADTVDGLHASSLIGGMFKNRIINGSFQVWQRGTSFTTTGYTADRWRFDTDTDDTFTISKQSTDGNEPFVASNYVNLAFTAGATGTYNKFAQRLEFPKLYFGKTITLSYYIKADVSTNITNTIKFVFNNLTYNPITTPSIVVDTDWTKITYTFNLSTPTGFVESGSDYLEVAFDLPVNVTSSIDIANVQLEDGDVATEFEYVPYDIELMRCMRYYETTEPHLREINCLYVNIFAASVWYDYKVVKRTTPTLHNISIYYSGYTISSVNEQITDKYIFIRVAGNYLYASIQFQEGNGIDAEL